MADPLVGVTAFSESFANLRTGLSSAGAVFAFFDGDISVESVKIGMLARFDLTHGKKYDVIDKQTVVQMKEPAECEMRASQTNAVLFGGLHAHFPR